MKLFLGVLFIILESQCSMGDVILYNSPRLKYTDPRYTTPPWGPWVYCPNLHYALGANVRVETDANKDDTTINSICLFCGPTGGRVDTTNKTLEICSVDGVWGNFLEKPLECKYLLVGFQAAQDRTFNELAKKFGVVSIKFICSDEDDQEVTSKIDFPYGERQRCLSGQAICGIRTQIDTFDKEENAPDQAGLINVEMKCCDLPSPEHVDGFCEPRDAWKVDKTCNNLNSGKDFSCTNQQTTGLKVALASAGVKAELNAREALRSATLPGKRTARIYQADFVAGLARSKGSTTGYDWTMESPNTFAKGSSTTVNFVVPPHTKTTIFQVVGYCGPYTLRSTKFVRVDTKDSSKVPYPPALPGGFFCDDKSSVSSTIVSDVAFPPKGDNSKPPKS